MRPPPRGSARGTRFAVASVAHSRRQARRTSSRRLRDDATLVELDDALAPGGDTVVVGSGDERESELELKRIDQVEDADSGIAVELAGGLIAKKQLWALRE